MMYYFIMKLALLAAALFGLVSSFYHWRPAPYSPLVLNQSAPSFSVDETFFYAPKVNQPFTDPGELVGALLVKLVGFSGADFIFPALTFLALFLLLKTWLKNEVKAVTASLIVLIFYHYLTYFPYLPSIGKLLANYWNSGTYLTLIRSFHPQIGLGLFLIFSLALWRQSRWWLTALLLTLLTYTHFFYWTVALAWLVWLGLNRRLVKILVVWIFLTLPYWAYLFRLMPALDYWQRNYFYQPASLTQWLVLLLGVLLSTNKFWRRFYTACFTSVIAAMLIKFGADDPIGHWFLRVVNPMTGTLLTLTILKKINFPKTIWLGLSLLLLLFQFRLHFQYFKNNDAAFLLEPARLEAFNWLKANTPKNSIVASGMKDSLYLPAYTNNQPYLKQAQLSRATNQELVQRFLEVYRLAGFDDQQLAALFAENQELKSKKRFDFDNCAGHFLFFRLYRGADYYSCTVPEAVLDDILGQYAQTPIQLSYPADYWLGTKNLDFGRLLWENQQYKIYALN